MRNDVAGMFWDDTPPPKPPPKEKPKRIPPERTWERPDYLPNLAEAKAFNVPLFTDAELVAATYARERMIFDIECYPNYFLIAFTGLSSRKVVYFEMTPECPLDVEKLGWIMRSFCLVSFNGIQYDIPIAALALAGKDNGVLMWATEEIILRNERPQDVLKRAKVKGLKVNHIDLIEVAPLRANLKIYSGRLHAPRMQDLPFKPGTILSNDQMDIVRWYCCNDLENTCLMYEELNEHIQLREQLGLAYGLDLRSKSDAQIAEAVIAHEVAKINGARSGRPDIPPGTRFKYNVPAFIQYHSLTMQWTLEQIRNASFLIDDRGEVGLPPELKDLSIQIAGGVYRMGIGGLHSSEKKQAHFAGEDVKLIDWDMTSYYPYIILNQGLYPIHLGRAFLQVYQQLVDRRIHAKKTGNKTIADSLKITINGSFGKLGSPYSVLYSPHLLIQTTITGQLTLLMLIERLELAGIPVVSANTDGIIVKCPTLRLNDAQGIVRQWERDTGFQTEETRYRAVFSRDVNNYIAIKENLETKVKGAYAEKGSSGNSVLSKNPTGLICIDAVLAFLTTGRSITDTIRNCRDIRRFVVVRSVTGGAVKDGNYLGKSIRWYYATGEQGEIIYAKNGNMVPRSTGGKPCMLLPTTFPEDINYDWYEGEALSILEDLAYPGIKRIEEKEVATVD